MATTQVSKTLTSQQKEGLQVLLGEIAKGKNSGNFLKMKAGDKKVLQFDPDKIEKTTNEKFGGQRIKFGVFDVNESKDMSWETSLSNGEQVIKFILEGFSLLKIERQGSAINDTKYFIVPAGQS